MLFRSRPELLHHILKTTAEAVTQYLHAQIEAGVDAIMIFDSWGGALSHQGYLEFSLPYMKVILSNLKMMNAKKIPSIIFTKGGGLCLRFVRSLTKSKTIFDLTELLSFFTLAKISS